jgi:micrococcal nuclease
VSSVQYKDCYDGDTCTFDLRLGLGVGLYDQQVRLCDIDAPELRDTANKTAAVRSRNFLRDALAKAEQLWVVIYGKDKYGRWLGEIFVDGYSINKTMVSKNYAALYEDSCY